MQTLHKNIYCYILKLSTRKFQSAICQARMTCSWTTSKLDIPVYIHHPRMTQLMMSRAMQGLPSQAGVVFFLQDYCEYVDYWIVWLHINALWTWMLGSIECICKKWDQTICTLKNRNNVTKKILNISPGGVLSSPLFAWLYRPMPVPIVREPRSNTLASLSLLEGNWRMTCCSCCMLDTALLNRLSAGLLPANYCFGGVHCLKHWIQKLLTERIVGHYNPVSAPLVTTTSDWPTQRQNYCFKGKQRDCISHQNETVALKDSTSCKLTWRGIALGILKVIPCIRILICIQQLLLHKSNDCQPTVIWTISLISAWAY